MSDRRRRKPGGFGAIGNLLAGDHSPLERLGMVAENVGRRLIRRQTCCGHYGDPGC
jgi:hypothetical protein